MTVYVTTKKIINPYGDGRHERSKEWRSPLQKKAIPEGWCFAIVNGQIEDRSVSAFTLETEPSTLLIPELLKVASTPLPDIQPAPPTMEEIVSEAPDGAVAAVLKSLNVDPQVLRSLLAGGYMPTEVAAPKPAKPSSASKSVIRRATIAAVQR